MKDFDIRILHVGLLGLWISRRFSNLKRMQFWKVDQFPFLVEMTLFRQ